MNETVVETRDLTKRYGKFVAVDSLNLNIASGEVFGLLGPNGSGKTTTILMLLGLTDPTSGQVRVLGYDPVRQPLSVKQRVGYLPDQIGFYDGMTARENLSYIARLNGLPHQEAARRIEEAIEQMGLSPVLNRRVKTFSRGMRQRLGVAELLIKRPQIIIMDEPTLGLDPEAAHLLLRIIADLRETGITILLSSHLLHQVQEICDRVALFHKGRVVLAGAINELAERVLGGIYHVTLCATGYEDSLLPALRALPGVADLHIDTGGEMVLEASADVRAEVASLVIQHGGRLQSLAIQPPSLDTIYARYFEEVEHGRAA